MATAISKLYPLSHPTGRSTAITHRLYTHTPGHHSGQVTTITPAAPALGHCTGRFAAVTQADSRPSHRPIHSHHTGCIPTLGHHTGQATAITPAVPTFSPHTGRITALTQAVYTHLATMQARLPPSHRLHPHLAITHAESLPSHWLHSHSAIRPVASGLSHRLHTHTWASHRPDHHHHKGSRRIQLLHSLGHSHHMGCIHTHTLIHANAYTHHTDLHSNMIPTSTSSLTSPLMPRIAVGSAKCKITAQSQDSCICQCRVK